MAINKGKPDAGKGGKLGRSNMAYWGTNAEEKEDARKRRRQADRAALQEGLRDTADGAGLIGFVTDQLSALGDLVVKPMFGGAGLYLDGQFFGIFFKERLYFRVSSRTVGAYTARRMKPFKPFEGKGTSRNYYEVPVDIIESPEDLVKWAKIAVEAASSTPSRRPKKPARKSRSAR